MDLKKLFSLYRPVQRLGPTHWPTGLWQNLYHVVVQTEVTHLCNASRMSAAGVLTDRGSLFQIQLSSMDDHRVAQKKENQINDGHHPEIRLLCETRKVSIHPCVRFYQKSTSILTDCSPPDRVIFNTNLVKIFNSEYKRFLELHSKVSTKSSITDMVVIDWKFSNMDSNNNHMLDKNEYRELKRLIKKVCRGTNVKLLKDNSNF
jgi:hypothetical protein